MKERKQWTRLVLTLFSIVLVVGLFTGITGLDLHALTGLGEGEKPGGRFLFLYVEEQNTHALAAAPVLPRKPVAWFSSEDKALVVKYPEDLPGAKTRAVVFYRVENLGLEIFSRVYLVDRFPFTLDLGSLLEWYGVVYDPAGGGGKLVNLINNKNRLAVPGLVFEEIQPDGSVPLAWGEKVVVVPPGGSWGVAQVRRSDGTVVMVGEENWERELSKALSSRVPVTRYSVSNYGWWDKKRATWSGGP
mgnify:CR=1 FL=1